KPARTARWRARPEIAKPPRPRRGAVAHPELAAPPVLAAEPDLAERRDAEAVAATARKLRRTDDRQPQGAGPGAVGPPELPRSVRTGHAPEDDSRQRTGGPGPPQLPVGSFVEQDRRRTHRAVRRPDRLAPRHGIPGGEHGETLGGTDQAGRRIDRA